ncbi:MAG: hypothetical protein C00003105_01022 [ANME-2 cluster archaeon HR1]|nr:MAG: hypothetical protein C5S41_06290 [ANME-2 cluster archaeon]KAF5425392.1 hypothetical protein C5S42_10820 [ANME-2 cluster archaeon]PPA78848.1 MAG: hypothetical protein C00003105_01022 [ANME-2 cluster archaeon HR1]
MRNKVTQLGTVLTVILLISMSFLPAVNAEMQTKDTTNKAYKSCDCDREKVNIGNEKKIGAPKEISGQEKEKWVEKTLRNKGVIEIQKKLKKEYFILQNTKAFTVPVETEDGLKTDVILLTISYNKRESEEGKTIIYIYNPVSKESTAILLNGNIGILGFTQCAANLAICLGTAIGCGVVCAPVLVPDPLEAAEIYACLACISVWGGACTLAYCECADYFCSKGYQGACEHKCDED